MVKHVLVTPLVAVTTYLIRSNGKKEGFIFAPHFIIVIKGNNHFLWGVRSLAYRLTKHLQQTKKHRDQTNTRLGLQSSTPVPVTQYLLARH